MKTFIIVATTLDGFIGKDTQDVSTRWTSKADSTWFRQRTVEAGICVMGRQTYETFNRPLPDRITMVQTRNPVDWQKKQLKVGTRIEIINARTDVASLMSERKTQVWATALGPAELHQLLVKAGVVELAVCGGASIYTQWLMAGLVDELYLTVEPVIFGQGVRLFNQPVDVKLEFMSERKLNERGTKVVGLKLLNSKF